MRTQKDSVTIMIHRDGAVESTSIRLPGWLARLLAISGIVLGAAIILGIAFYIPMARAAAQVPGLHRRIADLETENGKIRELAAALDSAEAHYATVRTMIGGDIVPRARQEGGTLPVALPLAAVAPGVVPTGPAPVIPARWPLDEPGYVTRGQVGTGTADEAHPGIDIAVPEGTLVRASASGSVAESGIDPQYGNFVLLQHEDDYQTMYGHLSRILVRTGAQVQAGQVIGLSGNTGRSSAPHLHFEIRRDGSSVDPTTMVKEGG
ncbi:MAG TPA: M23 family metallopeptidase [Gemmatimonadales bacterium]|nr:M23 family metallopeptidase [Gemmatimonadales bacterium]